MTNTLLNIKIITEYPIWFIIFCLLLGGIYAFVLYRKATRFEELSKWMLQLMGFLRFSMVSILSFLLLSPFIKTLSNKVEKPIIVIAQDNSSSILMNKDSIFYQTDYLDQLATLKAKLSEKYEVKSYAFGEEVKEGNQIDFTEKVTNFSNLFDEMGNKFLIEMLEH